MEKVLVNSDKYDGQYVALVSADDNTIAGAGNTPEEALDEARKKGTQSPFLLYVPDKNVVQDLHGITIAYSHTVCIKAFDFSTENVLIDFMPNLHVPLLGVKSFLNNFTLRIDYPNKIFSII